MSRENLKATLEAFRAGRFVADVSREVFQAISPPVDGWTTSPALASSWALLPASKSSYSVASKASTQCRTPGSSRSLVTPQPKSTSTPASREPITIEESAEGGSKGGAEVAPSAPQPKRVAASGAIMIRDATNKRASPTDVPPEG